MEAHRNAIIRQFTAQADGFAHAAAIRDEAALDLLVGFSGAGPRDRVLDVACGPGLVVCAFARVAQEASGIDITPAMIERAREHAARLGLTNAQWRLGEIPPLPWPDDAFDIVVSRYAFHHLEDPLAVLREMVRVCAPGGRVIVCDLALAPEKVDAFNAMDCLRDHSHVRACTLEQLRELILAAGLAEPRVAAAQLVGELEGLLERSFPAPGGADEVRRRFRASLEGDQLGVDARLVPGGRIAYSYPIAMLAADVP